MQEGGRGHRGEKMPICRSPQPHPSTPHTPELMKRNQRAATLSSSYGRATLCVWSPQQCPWGCSRSAWVKARATARSGSVECDRCAVGPLRRGRSNLECDALSLPSPIVGERFHNNWVLQYN